MTGIILPVIQARIPKTDICIVILIRIVEICFALDIISFCYGNQKRIDNILHIVRNKRGIDLLVFMLAIAFAMFVGFVRELI